MSEKQQVLGIDLASRSWQDNGSAILTFSTGQESAWEKLEFGCIQWPTRDLIPVAMAETIDDVVVQRGIAAVSLDGPQGWREPDAATRPGVGRVCEYEARCQGKTGEFGKTYPQTQHGWIQFCIEVFAELLRIGNARIANDDERSTLDPVGPGKYWLLECFPTSTWRASRLAVLPGKSRIGKRPELVSAYARTLQQRYRLPDLEPWVGTHDDLQAVAAALPAAGLLGGPCIATPKGKPAWHASLQESSQKIWVEGLIWDATRSEAELAVPVELPELSGAVGADEKRVDSIAENPLLIDERDDNGEQLLERGVRLFQHLAQLANQGEARGVGYGQFVAHAHGVDSFSAVTNRKYWQSDTRHVLSFAHQVTEACGGRIPVTRDDVTIEAGMDAFIWRRTPPHARPSRAFEEAGYSEEEWKLIFPDGERRLLNSSVCELPQACRP